MRHGLGFTALSLVSCTSYTSFSCTPSCTEWRLGYTCFYLKESTVQQPVFDTHRYRYAQRLCWLRPWPSRRRQNKEFLGPTLAKLQADALICKLLLEANGKGRVVNVHILKDVKTHKQQIMSSISKVVKILGRCFLSVAWVGGHTPWFPLQACTCCPRVFWTA